MPEPTCLGTVPQTTHLASNTTGATEGKERSICLGKLVASRDHEPFGTARMYREICAMFARYNGWANERVYAGAAGLSEEEFGADRGVFFGSMRGTLNHLLVADRVWMRRFTGEGPAPKALDTILHEDLPTLHSARRQEDARMREWITGLTDADIDRTFTFRTIVDPRDMTQKLGPALAHVFNHQTHHRGQAHAILTGFGRQVPSLDVITFQRETGAS